MIIVTSWGAKPRQMKSSWNFKPLKRYDSAEHDGSLFPVNTSKLRTGLSCHHNLNCDKSHSITCSIEKDVDHFIGVLDRVSAKYWATYKIGSKSKPSEARKKREQKKKGNNRRITASDNRRKRAGVICRSLGGTPLENDYEPEICGILQLQSDFRFRSVWGLVPTIVLFP